MDLPIGNNKKNTENTIHQKSYLLYLPGKCGSSSVVEHQLPKLRVAGSTPVSRSEAGLNSGFFYLFRDKFKTDSLNVGFMNENPQFIIKL